jgi:hypothetical protein
MFPSLHLSINKIDLRVCGCINEPFGFCTSVPEEYFFWNMVPCPMFSAREVIKDENAQQQQKYFTITADC